MRRAADEEGLVRDVHTQESRTRSRTKRARVAKGGNRVPETVEEGEEGEEEEVRGAPSVLHYYTATWLAAAPFYGGLAACDAARVPAHSCP